MKRASFLVLAAASLLRVAAQHQPFIVHDTKPVITNGPLLLAPAETSATVVWMTDTPCHSKVVFGTGGKLDSEAEPQAHGLVPVGTRHAIHITGLAPGRTYQYKIVSTRVVKMKPYWPEKGLSTESPVYSFTTLDRARPSFSFSLITDTHADLARIESLVRRIDWNSTDLLVHLGDAFDTETEEMIWSRWLDPLSKALAHTRPLFHTRGNHEARGAAARALAGYVPIPEGRFYYARDHGPVHFILLDTGEDKPDSTNVYSGLNRFKQYREQEFAWLDNHVKTEPRVASAPFRVLLMHAPNWGWTDDQGAKWTELANKAGIDLAISGHTHRFAHIAPGQKDNRYHQLVIGPEDLARVDVSQDEMRVTVDTKDGAPVSSFTVRRRGR
jgi:predicted phosphodiesterase